MNYVIARERVVDVLEEIKPILLEHWAELSLYSDIPLDPEYDVYEMLDKKGLLALYTIRTAGVLVGYAVYFVRKHMHYRQHTWALSDIILVKKEHRNLGMGMKLFDTIESEMKSYWGVDVLHTMTKVMHPELAYLLESRGHQKAEVSYSLRL